MRCVNAPVCLKEGCPKDRIAHRLTHRVQRGARQRDARPSEGLTQTGYNGNCRGESASSPMFVKDRNGPGQSLSRIDLDDTISGGQSGFDPGRSHEHYRRQQLAVVERR